MIYYVTLYHRDSHINCLVYGMDLAEFVVTFYTRHNRRPNILSFINISQDEFDEVQEYLDGEYIYIGQGEITE